MTCLGVLDKKRHVTKTNETGLKEGGVIEMSATDAFPYTRCTLSLFAYFIFTFLVKFRN